MAAARHGSVFTNLIQPPSGDQRNPSPTFDILASHTWVTSIGSGGLNRGSGAPSRMTRALTENGAVVKRGDGVCVAPALYGGVR